jgi:4-hydroxybenzoyl-CoA reductase subunit beta
VLRIAPTFIVETPATIDEALALLAKHGPDARLVAGGTDLLPNLKHGLYEPKVLVSLARVAGLDAIDLDGDPIALGAAVKLHALAEHAGVRALLPSLADALGRVAGPQHRRMGTLGGNVCLDTRCVYINQSYFWRESLGFCIKKDGTECHVTKTGRKCVAAASNDSAPVLLTLDARLEIAGPGGRRKVPIDDFYVNDGVKNNALEPGELVTRVLVPRPAAARRAGFEKLRIRDSIDFPMLNVAVAFDLVDGQALRPDLVVSAIAARPRRVKGLPDGALTPDLIAAWGDRAFQSVRPLPNINGDVEWRREMVPVLVRRAVERAVER